MKQYSRVCAKINLDRIEYNIQQMEKHISPNTKMILVVKADRYGHGAIPIAQMAEDMQTVWG